LSIEFNCSCGRALRVRDESLRGRKVKCPACGTLADVPGEPPPPAQEGPSPVADAPAPSSPREGGRKRRRRPRRRGRRGGQKPQNAPAEGDGRADQGHARPPQEQRQGDRPPQEQRQGDRPPQEQRQGDRPPRRKRRPRNRNRRNRQSGPRTDRNGRRRLQPQERQPVEVGGGIPAGPLKPPPEPPAPAQAPEEKKTAGPISSFFKRLFGR